MREFFDINQPEVIVTKAKPWSTAVNRESDKALRSSLQKHVKDDPIDRTRGHQQRNHDRIYSGGFHHRATSESSSPQVSLEQDAAARHRFSFLRRPLRAATESSPATSAGSAKAERMRALHSGHRQNCRSGPSRHAQNAL
jgi:hypothetical protein